MASTSQILEPDVEHGRIESPSEDSSPPRPTNKRRMSMATSMATYYDYVWDNIKSENVPKHMGWKESVTYMVRSLHWISILLLAIPFAWAAHFEVDKWGHQTTFTLCFIAMIPLQRVFDWGGEEMGSFLDKDLRDLLIITMSNAVEATLAIILLLKCHLRLLQSTIVGVVLLHLLLIPGVAFFVQGTQYFEQMLHPHHTNLNLSLLMIGVLATLVPTAFFAALDRGVTSSGNGAQASDPDGLPAPFVPLVGDAVRGDILRMSRGISVVLLVIYVMSYLYRHVLPIAERPGHASRQNSTSSTSSSDPQMTPLPKPEIAAPTAGNTPRSVHPWFCAILLVVAVGLMAPTAEFLVSSIEDVSESTGIQTEWFGLVLLPIASFSADGVVVIGKFTRQLYYHILSRVMAKHSEVDPDELPEALASEFAHGRPIDLSIQFTLWWTPFLVLLGWWTNKPMHLLFDYFEVALLLGSCFLVNYVMADSKTNMSEGLTMISFYVMIATAVWYYPGQPQVAFMLNCPGTVAEAVANGVEGTRELVAL